MNDNKVLAYGMYILSLLIFGTNGIFVSHISLASSQTVLMRTILGGALLTTLVLSRGGFDKKSLKEDGLALFLGGSALGFNWVALFAAYGLLNVTMSYLAMANVPYKKWLRFILPLIAVWWILAFCFLTYATAIKLGPV